MTIVGKLARDSQVNTLPDDRRVVNFSIAVTDTFKTRKEGRQRVTSYIHCAWWLDETIAAHLKKGVLVQIDGRVWASASTGRDGVARASLNCHVNRIRILSGANEVALLGRPFTEVDTADDIPF